MVVNIWATLKRSKKSSKTQTELGKNFSGFLKIAIECSIPLESGLRRLKYVEEGDDVSNEVNV